MAKTVEEINEEIKQLSPEDRHRLLDQLLSEEESIKKAWTTEAERRWKEIEEGKVKTIPGDQVLAEARRMLSEKL